jgi:hypothetical protein
MHDAWSPARGGAGESWEFARGAAAVAPRIFYSPRLIELRSPLLQFIRPDGPTRHRSKLRGSDDVIRCAIFFFLLPQMEEILTRAR